MRYGIASDIHGNAEALCSALEAMVNVDKLICTGDVVGYGPDPNECCELLRSHNCATVIGNHDAVVADLVSAELFNPIALKAIRWTKENLSEANRKYLEMLPATVETDHFIMVHATLKNPLTFHYIDSITSARPCFKNMKHHTLCFIGHTHLAQVYMQPLEGEMVNQIELRQGGKLELKPDYRYIVNCGSVGQPRDGNKLASCGIYDTETNTVEIIRVGYDIEKVQARMREIGLPHPLIERLAYGE